jgi:hypothetical protein
VIEAEDRLRGANVILALSKVPAHLSLEVCWPWLGGLNGHGYGTQGTTFRGFKWLAHRLVYEIMVGPIPKGLTLDHLCRNHACVNPLHLEPVTAVENVMRGDGWAARKARQTHCTRGHPLTEDNIYRRGGRWRCRTCALKWRQRAAEANSDGR